MLDSPAITAITLDISDGQSYGLSEITLIVFLDEVRDYLGIGLRGQSMAFLGKLVPKFLEIVYHPVVNNGNPAVTITVGMSVYL
jgi:hypothetical protein